MSPTTAGIPIDKAHLSSFASQILLWRSEISPKITMFINHMIDSTGNYDVLRK